MHPTSLESDPVAARAYLARLEDRWTNGCPSDALRAEIERMREVVRAHEQRGKRRGKRG